MEIIFEILKIVLPAIIAGLFTFFVTKYTYNKNRPLDKIEIAYNRVYYPLYRLITNQDINEDIDLVIHKAKDYFNKYDKYIDKSTIRIYKTLCEYKTNANKKNAYRIFKNNIYDKNSYLRRRLGYLEPNFAQSYKYATPSTKSLFRISIEFGVMYIALILCSITMNKWNVIYIIFFVIFCGTLILIIVEIIWCLIRFIYYKIRK